MNQTKKAQTIFSVIMLVAFVFLLFTAVVRMNKVESRTETIGETTIELKQVYEEAEKVLFYIEQSAQYVVYSIIEEMKNDIPLCGEDTLPKITRLFEQRLKSYESLYSNKDISFSIENNYELKVINDENILIANAKSNLMIPFSKGEYSINPSFSLKANHNFSECATQETTEEEGEGEEVN